MTSEPFVYEAKFGWNRRSVRLVVVGTAFCIAGLVLGMPLWEHVVVVGFFALCTLGMLAASLSRKTALRVDASGVTTCRSPLQPGLTRVYHWKDIDTILVWTSGRISYLGIQRQHSAPPLGRRRPRAATRAALRVTANGVPQDAAAHALPTAGWSLELDALTSAVAHFAPRVRVVDVATGRPLEPGQPG